MRVQKQAAGLDPRFREIPCPVLRTLANEQRIDVGPEGQVDMEQLKKALRGIGASELVSQVLVRGGHSASPVKPELLRDQGRKELDFFRLRGSTLDHKGDSQVLRDPNTTFSPERLAGLLALSSDGKTLTLADLSSTSTSARVWRSRRSMVVATTSVSSGAVAMAASTAVSASVGRFNAINT